MTAERSVIHVTAHVDGFYINRTTDSSFDRREHANNPCHSHTLVGLLSSYSPAFKSGFRNLNPSLESKHAYETVATPYTVMSWLSHAEEHVYDEARAEDAAATWSEADLQNPGLLRDWNEELQSIRELPQDSQGAKSLRARALYKFHTDYVATACRGAQAVVLGNVPPMNPLDEKASHMFTWSNIFFSFATDSRGIYQEMGGENAAHAAAGNDLKGVKAYDQLGSKDLYTLATVVVDYMGQRVVAQSIVPGILRCNQTSSIVYGANEIEGCMVIDPKFNDALGKTTEALHIKQHTVLYGKSNTEYEINASAECKGAW